MLKLYTDTDFLIEKYRKNVFPLLFDLHFVKSDVLLKHYCVTDSIKKSDIVVIPLEYSFFGKNFKNITQIMFNEAKKANKPLWVYSGGDLGYSFKNQDIYNFRLSGFKSKLNSRTFVMPVFINDPYTVNLNKQFSVIEKSPMPKIGFVGNAKAGSFKYLKELSSYFKSNIKRLINKEYKDYQPFYPSSTKRAKYLNVLKNSNKLLTNFIYRGSYRAGVKTIAEKEKTTQEFYQNIYNNPYTFCLRGGGNFSVRFYETLAVGRIPILINTDCLLPLSNIIDWSKHCVIINESDYKTMEKRIVEFHNNLSNQDFIALQKRNRDLWCNYLRRHTFFKEIFNYFKSKTN